METQTAKFPEKDSQLINNEQSFRKLHLFPKQGQVDIKLDF